MMRQQGQGRGFVVAVAIAVSWGVGNSDTASAKGKLKTQQTALFLITADAPDPDVVQAVARALPAVTARAPRLNLVTGMELRRRIGKQPTKALAACGADFACLAKLGAKADARTMVIVRVTPGEKGTRIQFVIIDVGAKVMSARIELDIGAAAEFESQLELNFRDIFGVPLPKAKPPAEEPITAAGETDPPAAEIAQTASAHTPPDSTADGPRGRGPDEAVAKKTGSALELEALPELEAVAPAGPLPERTIAADYVMYAGIGLLGAGIVVGAIGAVFGSNGESAGAAITDDVPQTDAIRRRDEANSQIEMANTMYIAGGATAGVGAIMLVLGLIEPGFLGGGQASVAVHNGGAQVNLSFPLSLPGSLR